MKNICKAIFSLIQKMLSYSKCCVGMIFDNKKFILIKIKGLQKNERNHRKESENSSLKVSQDKPVASFQYAESTQLGLKPIMSNKVIYISEDLVQVAGINFRISTTDYSISTDELNVALLKPTSFLEYYENMIFRENVKNVVEFGIFEGGMAVFLTSLKKDLRYLGIDLKSPVTGLQNFLNNHNEIAQRIVTQYNMGQSDARVPKLIVDFLEGEALDLIIDDASHEYFFSRKTFELCFPLLKDGGLYIIEDWGWLHWIGFEIPAQWKDLPALTNLVLELIMLCASRPGLIAEINVFFNMMIIKKGKEQIKGDFALEDFIQMNRRKIVFL